LTAAVTVFGTFLWSRTGKRGGGGGSEQQRQPKLAELRAKRWASLEKKLNADARQAQAQAEAGAAESGPDSSTSAAVGTDSG
jgi:hypothetical protein